MENKINPRLKNIEISGIRKFFNMVSDYKDVISLTIGQPDFPTPAAIKQAGIQAIHNNETTYTHNAGIMELRHAISTYVFKHYQLSYNPADEIIVTVGASQAIDISLRTIIEAGDEVILPGPVYPGYEPLIKLAGGIPVHVDTSKLGFKMTAASIEPYISPSTKAVILPYPSNPTGVSLNEEELAEIAKLIKKHKIFLIADEIYSELVYEGAHTSVAKFKEARDHIIVINGVSKSHAMTGWRIGYVLAPQWLSKHLLKAHQYNVSCATSVSQYAALEALTNGETESRMMREEYSKRKEYVLERLDRMGISYIKPDGAFYVFPSLSIEGLSTFDLAVKLVDEAGVALVPGDAFSNQGEGFMRLSYAYSMDTLKEGLDRLERFLLVHYHHSSK
ncbi:aminotransferase A [Halobacillus locisalis]|uniref:Aminotransferase n=1 Tax=Halobacillus locisalis TaxID=220753 RepID=A0A838CRI0_9BACI|nr:aminotransferase A [Halobacillus locisalis]MBA2174365.1 aminotransferase A [Halobacillus locisalis]